MIDFSTLKELYLDGKKVTSLFLDGHEVPVGEEAPKYLTVTALERFAAVSINKIGSPPDFSLEYSTDGNMWSSYSAGQPIGLLPGTSVMFRRDGEATTTFSSGSSAYWKFSFGQPVKVSGNVMSLIDASMKSTTAGQYVFYRLFYDQSNLVDAGELELPATTASANCYAGMFYHCTSLSSAPAVLPAVQPWEAAYQSMFEKCAFTTAPLICSQNGGIDFYRYMLNHCSNLTSLSVNFTNWNMYRPNWVESINEFGEFHCPSALGMDETIYRGNAFCPPNFIVGNYDVDGSLMSNAAVRTSYATAFLEDGSSHCPTASSLSVFNGNTCQLLVDNTDYTIAFPSDTTTAGVKTIAFNGTGSYTGTKTFTYEIFARDLSNCTKSIGPVYDDEGPLYSTIVQPETDYTLVEGIDYTVAVSTSGDQSTVTITGIGSWTGTYTTTVAYKTSGTSPLAVYKHDPNESGNAAVKLVNSNGPAVDMQVKGMTNGTWQKMEYDTTYSDPAGLWIRAADVNNRLATSDSNYNYFDFNNINFSNGCSVGLSGHLESLLDRTQQLTSIDTDSAFNRTFKDIFNAGQQKLVDASKLEIKPMLLKSSKSIVGLFQNCTALTAVPDFTGLSTIGHKQWAFVENFRGCSHLYSASYTLPWLSGPSQTKDSNGLYQFRDDTSMTDFTLHSHFGDGRVCDDSLSSTNLYFNRLMLQNCSQLTCISTDISSWPYNGFENWVSGVAATGTFICPTALGTDATIQRGNSYCPTGWTVVNYDAKPVPLKFTAQQSNSTIALSALGTPPSVSLLKSTDGETWTSYTVNDTITLADIGDYVMLKADQPNSRFASSNSDYSQFVMTGRISAEGDIMSLLDGGQKTSTISSERCFQNLFAACSQLTQAPELPATELCSNCYMNMFGGCTSLSTAPELPAETLANECYKHMFRNCTSLISAPVLPATALANECCNSMLSGCTSLSTAPELPATTLADYCYLNMFGGCTSLISAPVLPATTLCSNCYASMFNGCSSLSAMDVKFTAWSPSNATQNWLSGVAAAGTFKCPADLDTTISDASHVPAGWTVEVLTVQYADYVSNNQQG